MGGDSMKWLVALQEWSEKTLVTMYRLMVIVLVIVVVHHLCQHSLSPCKCNETTSKEVSD